MASTAPDDNVPSASSSPGKQSNRDKRWSQGNRASMAPVSFIMKSQDQMDADRAAAAQRATEDNMFGVESLKDTIRTADRIESDDTDSLKPLEPSTVGSGDHPRFSMPTSFNLPMHLDLSSADRPPSLSRAPHLHSPALDSGPLSTPQSASVRSFRLSDDELSVDEASSQALASSDDGDGEYQMQFTPEHHQGYALDEAAPQLVMPSIRMPARRPFTERGKNIGRLKAMVAGRAEAGKTSLIRSIVQTCEDIVHVDPIDTSSIRAMDDEKATIRSAKDLRRHGIPFMTVNASTRPYPTWWADLDESRVLRRRNSTNETVLERNVSFIDTPGFHSQSSFELYRASLIDHIQKNLHRNASLASLGEGEILGVLSGTGGFQVDLVFYVCSEVPDAEEASFMRRLSQLTNLIPISSKSDLSSPQELSNRNELICKALDTAGVKSFDLRKYAGIDKQQTEVNHPFSVSGATSRDDDNMDASLLMSSGYMAPLEPSQLPLLVDALFEPQMISCLRHSASKKYIQWHRSFANHAPSMSLNTLRPGRLPSRATSSHSTHQNDQASESDSVLVGPYLGAAYTPPSSGTSAASPSSSPLFPLLSTNNPYALARITDHTQREERLAQAHLARWAADLQRALRNERARFAAMQDTERQAWLHRRLEECVSVDACKQGGSASSAIMLRSEDVRRRNRGETFNPQDPLGLLVWSDNFSRRSLVFAQLVGSAGVAGAVIIWAMNAWGWEMSAGVGGGTGYSWRTGFGWRWNGEWSWTF